MFTVEQRDALREHALRLAESDDRVVAGAAVDSLAIDDGDRFWLTIESPADGGTLVAATIPLPG